MRELLIAFIFALVVGSIINGMQQKPSNPMAASAVQGGSSAPQTSTSAERRDFPDFASFTNVDNDNFEQIVGQSNKPVLIDCYVPNNQACDQMIPLVAAVAKAHEDSVLMAKLNLMDNIVLAHRFGINNVPTFLLFDKGTLTGKLSGVLPQDRLESMIASLPRKNGLE